MSKSIAFFSCISLQIVFSQVAWALDSEQWEESIGAAQLAIANQDLSTAEELLKLTDKQATQQYQRFETARLLGRLYQKRNNYAAAQAAIAESESAGGTNQYFKTLANQELANLYTANGKTAEGETLMKSAQQTINHYEGMNLENHIKQVAIEANQLAVQSGASPKDAALKATITCLVDRTGTLSYAHVSESSGSKDFDRLALKSVKKVHGFTPRPIGSPEFIQIQIPICPNERLEATEK
jgi:TonB family protein